jgi:hypothetical protein
LSNDAIPINTDTNTSLYKFQLYMSNAIVLACTSYHMVDTDHSVHPFCANKTTRRSSSSRSHRKSRQPSIEDIQHNSMAQRTTRARSHGVAAINRELDHAYTILLQS